MKSKLLIIGAGGHGKVVADVAINMGLWKYIAFLDDDDRVTTLFGLDILGKVSIYSNYIDEYDIFVAIGNNKIREKILTELEALTVSVPILIHPHAVIANQVVIGNGTVIMAGVVINIGTRIGKGCIVNTSSSIDHDNTINDYVHVSPGVHIAGTVNVGNRVWLGIGSVISNNISIVEDSIVGAGTVVTKDIGETGVYVGVPAGRVK